MYVICHLRFTGATLPVSKLALSKYVFYHIKSDRNFFGCKIVIIVKPRQLLAYKDSVRS